MSESACTEISREVAAGRAAVEGDDRRPCQIAGIERADPTLDAHWIAVAPAVPEPAVPSKPNSRNVKINSDVHNIAGRCQPECVCRPGAAKKNRPRLAGH